jgi:hypothetical protein
MRRRTAAVGSAVFFLVAPGVVVGLIPWCLFPRGQGAGILLHTDRGLRLCGGGRGHALATRTISSLPELSTGIVALLGISHAGYLTAKAVPSNPAHYERA